MSETKDRKLRRVLSMAISLDAAIEETMGAMMDDNNELKDRKDRRAYDELEAMHGRLMSFYDEIGEICKKNLNTPN